jgi:hypothetical protein
MAQFDGYTAGWTSADICSCYTNAPTTLFGVSDNGGVYVYDSPSTIGGILFNSVDLSALTALTSATLILDCTPNSYGTTAGTFRIRCEASATPVSYASGNNPYHRTARTAYVDVTVSANQAAISANVTTLVQDLIDTYGVANITSISFEQAALYWGLDNAFICIVNDGSGSAPQLQVVYETITPVSGSATIVSSAWSTMTDGYILVGGTWQQMTNIQAILGETWVNQVP